MSISSVSFAFSASNSAINFLRPRRPSPAHIDDGQKQDAGYQTDQASRKKSRRLITDLNLVLPFFDRESHKTGIDTLWLHLPAVHKNLISFPVRIGSDKISIRLHIYGAMIHTGRSQKSLLLAALSPIRLHRMCRYDILPLQIFLIQRIDLQICDPVIPRRHSCEKLRGGSV